MCPRYVIEEKKQLERPAIKLILNYAYAKEVEFTTQTKTSMLRGKKTSYNERKNLILKQLNLNIIQQCLEEQ